MKDLVGFKHPDHKERNLYFSEQVDQKTIGLLTKEILEINELDTYYEKHYKTHGMKYVRKPIKIYIDSYGGYVYQCYGLLSVMNSSKTPIHTIVTGAAMSCGFMILIHGHKRFGYKLSTPLYHQIGGGTYGKVKDMEEHLVESKRLQKKLEELTLQKTNITKKQLKKIYKRKIDWYMSAKEALRLGVIDKIIK